MSHQKQCTTRRHSPRRAKRSQRRHSQSYQVNYWERENGCDKRQRELVIRNDSTSSIEGKRKELQKTTRRKNRKTINQTEMQLLKEKLDEIEILREQIEVFQFLLSSQDSIKNDDQKNSSCFSFLSSLNCKKSKTEILFENNEALNQKHDAKVRNYRKKSRRKCSDFKEKDEPSKQHRITNNNTIVLPEGYALSRQQSGDQIMSLNKKLEHQVYEIKEIKQTLKECVDLLKESKFTQLKAPQYRLILDDYINMNKVGKLENIFPNMCPEGAFLSVMNQSEKRFKENNSNEEFLDDDLFDEELVNSDHFSSSERNNEDFKNPIIHINDYSSGTKQTRETSGNRNKCVVPVTRNNSENINTHSNISVLKSDPKKKHLHGRKHVHYCNAEETSADEIFNQEITYHTDVPNMQPTDSNKNSRKISLNLDSLDNKFPEVVHEVYCTGRKKETVLKVSPFMCDTNGKCRKPPLSVTKALSDYSVVAASRKNVKKGNINPDITNLKSKKKKKHPVKFDMVQSDCSGYSEQYQFSKQKESFFARLVRFLCCKNK